MFSKLAIALPLAASLLEQANALSLHGHQQKHRAAVDKREYVEWVTVWETVYVTASADSETTFVKNTQPTVTVPSVTVQETSASTTSTVTSTTTTTTTSIPATTQPPVAASNVENPPASSTQTTLSTAVKPIISIPSISDIAPLPTPSSSSSSAPASTSAPSSGGASFAKRGLVYNDAGMANAFKQASGAKCGWAYNWGSSSDGLASNIPYAPLLWGTQDTHTSHWDSDAEAAIAAGAPALLGFNEPDMASQSNMSPQDAATAHAKYFSKYVGRIPIVSPAVTNSGSPTQGRAWLKDFMTACDATPGCHVDKCAVHWYSPAQYASTLFDHIQGASEICGGKPIWLTEFAPAGSDQEISDFLATNLPKLDALPALEAYSYFMVAQNILMSSSTALSTIGKVYASV